MTPRKLLLVASEDSYFFLHLLPIAREAIKAGFEVALATQVSDKQALLEREGIKIFPLKIRRASLNVFADICTIWQLIKIYRHFRPHVVQHFAIKPILYGTLTAWWCSVPRIINTFVGTGLLFNSQNLSLMIARWPVISALRMLFQRCQGCFIVQNEDDRKLLLHYQLAEPERIIKQCCVGVDFNTFYPAPEPAGVPVFTLAARLLHTKGVGEFVEAARILRQRSVTIRMVLVGEPDLANPTSVTMPEIQAWQEEGIIEWWGKRSDMTQVWHATNVSVLPSYSEGISRSQLEAAACHRALITTDAPGCRDLVQHQVDGLLVRLKDPVDLADAISLLASNARLRHDLATAAYEKVRANYEEKLLARKVVDFYSNC